MMGNQELIGISNLKLQGEEIGNCLHKIMKIKSKTPVKTMIDNLDLSAIHTNGIDGDQISNEMQKLHTKLKDQL